MPKKDDMIYTGQKTPPFSGYKAEKKTPFFWIILLVVGATTVGIIYFIVQLGKDSSSIEEEKENVPKKIEKEIEETPKKPIKEEPKKKVDDSPKLDVPKKTDIKIPGDLGARIQAAESLISSGNLMEARKVLYELYTAEKQDSAAKEKIEEIIGKINIEIFKSDIPSEEKKLYTIDKGDSLIKIANKFNTTVEAIQTSNRIDPGKHTIFPGKTLCIYQGDWKIMVSKTRKTLRLMDGDRLFKSYVVGIGKQDRTPDGEFEITLKQKDPVWYADGKSIPYGNPDNILGTRWMALTPVGSAGKNLKGYGIHGTWEPDSVGQATSNGCVRMKNEDIDELFAIVPQGTKVIIED
ncbi:MAG TPA: L,D-transpeptidase family protein [Victivallales bacterium]|nr:L,D-transpeptidase family protein [Victivallales bacterium]